MIDLHADASKGGDGIASFNGTMSAAVNNPSARR
jgi:hypothetical protein